MNDQTIAKRRNDAAAFQTALRTIRPVTNGSGERALQVARLAVEARRRRRMVFAADADLLGDPIWDALLELFIAEADGRALSTTSLVLAMHLPPSTGLRWVDHMEARGLLTRLVDPRDRRRCLIHPTDRARALVIQSLEPLSGERGGR